MKKRLLVALTFVFISLFAHAQTQVAVGIKGGLNFANLNVSNPKGTYESRTGFHAGAFALFKKEHFGLQPEIILSQQGTTVKINQRDYESNFNYINVPVLFKYYIASEQNGGGFNVAVGPQLGILQSAKGTVLDSVTFMLKQDQDIKRSYKKSDVSLCIGAGWDSPFGMTVDVRYNLGLLKIKEDDDDALKNQVFQLSVGFKLMKFGF